MNQKNISKLFFLLYLTQYNDFISLENPLPNPALPNPNPADPALPDPNINFKDILNNNKNEEKLREVQIHAAQLSTKLIEAAVKLTLTTLMKSLMLDPGIEYIKDSFKTSYDIYKIGKETLVLLGTINPNDSLYFTEEQKNFFSIHLNTVKVFLSNNTNKVIEEKINGTPIIVLGGDSGTGKSAYVMLLMRLIKDFALKKKPMNIFFKFILNNKFIPEWVKVLLSISPTGNATLLILSGAYFYNYGNDKEKAAAHFEATLKKVRKKIEGHPDQCFIVLLEEGDPLTQEPFATVLKVFTTEMTLLNKDHRNGLGLIFITTNYIEKIQETLSRRTTFVLFEAPNIETKINTLTYYLKKDMNVNNNPQYSKIILDHADELIKFFENFSHSDIENCIWHLKLINKNTNNIISFLDFLIVINIYWLKREKIVNKNANGKLKELDILIYKLKNLKNNFFNNLIEEPNVDNSINDRESSEMESSEMEIENN